MTEELFASSWRSDGSWKADDREGVVAEFSSEQEKDLVLAASGYEFVEKLPGRFGPFGSEIWIRKEETA